MAKLCIHCGEYPVFSHDHCQYCQKYRTDKKWLKLLLKQHKKGNTVIRPKSDKRIKQDKEYVRIKAEKKTQLKTDRKWKCIFCNIGFYDMEIPDWHHLNKRDGDLMTDLKYLYPAHNSCHIDNYHQATVKRMRSMFWYEGFLERLKEIDVNLWNKEIRKQDRS